MTITITADFNENLSKNNHWMQNKHGGRFKNPKTTKAQNDIAWQIKSQAHQSVWSKDAAMVIEMTVYRPNKKWDAQNFVDSCSDAIEMGTGVNDSKYTVHAIPEYDKKNPRIEIRISQ